MNPPVFRNLERPVLCTRSDQIVFRSGRALQPTFPGNPPLPGNSRCREPPGASMFHASLRLVSDEALHPGFQRSGREPSYYSLPSVAVLQLRLPSGLQPTCLRIQPPLRTLQAEAV